MKLYSPKILKIYNFITSCVYNFESFYSLFMSNCFLSKVVLQIKPVKLLSKLKEDRLQLIKDQQNKVGVYCLVNLINGHTYIGSSTNLSVRLPNYLNNSFLTNNKNKSMPIIEALLKYEQNNFAVLIVEFVDAK